MTRWLFAQKYPQPPTHLCDSVTQAFLYTAPAATLSCIVTESITYLSQDLQAPAYPTEPSFTHRLLLRNSRSWYLILQSPCPENSAQILQLGLDTQQAVRLSLRLSCSQCLPVCGPGSLGAPLLQCPVVLSSPAAHSPRKEPPFQLSRS